MTKEKQQQNLGKILWDIADSLRGAMNADSFRLKTKGHNVFLRELGLDLI